LTLSPTNLSCKDLFPIHQSLPPLEVDTQLPVRGVLVHNDVICIHDDFAMVG